MTFKAVSQQLNDIQRILKVKATPEAKAAHEKFVPGNERIYGVRNPGLKRTGAAIQNRWI